MGDFNKASLNMDGRFGEYVHVFQLTDGGAMEKDERNWKRKIWQIFPSCCASLLAIPFGIMLGWPSPMYPYLIQPSSVIPISMSQSAMIAGFLMLGVTIATPIASKYHLGPKYGIWIGMVFITSGWILMWYSKDIFWLLGSRLIVGLGSGYGMGQVKSYIHDMCEPKLAATLTKQLNFYGLFGVIIAFITGTFLEFKTFPFVPVITSFVLLFVIMFLPCTPKDFVKSNKMDQAITLLDYLRGKKDHTNEMKEIQNELEFESEEFLVPILKDKMLREQFIKFILLVFLQQFTGGPTTIIYCQLIFTRSGCPYPEYCAILYSIMYFLSNIYGVFYASRLNRKIVLIFSCVTSSIMLTAQVLVLYFEINQKFWPFTSFVIMLLFISCYSIGLGNIPFTYIPSWFPKKYKLGMTDLFIMEFSMLALTATKVFQVFITSFSLYVGFCMFLVIDLICLIFVIIFVKDNPETSENYINSNTVYFWNTHNSNNVKNVSSR